MRPALGVCPSGQRERAVNPSAQPTEVRILPPPFLVVLSTTPWGRLDLAGAGRTGCGDASALRSNAGRFSEGEVPGPTFARQDGIVVEVDLTGVDLPAEGFVHERWPT